MGTIRPEVTAAVQRVLDTQNDPHTDEWTIRGRVTKVRHGVEAALGDEPSLEELIYVLSQLNSPPNPTHPKNRILVGYAAELCETLDQILEILPHLGVSSHGREYNRLARMALKLSEDKPELNRWLNVLFPRLVAWNPYYKEK